MKIFLILYFIHTSLFLMAQVEECDSFGCKYYDEILNVDVYTHTVEPPKDTLGGNGLVSYIMRNLIIPPQEQLQFTAYFYVILSSDGCPVRVWVSKKQEDEYTPLEESILKLVWSMPQIYKPAKYNGKPVYFRMFFPLRIDYSTE